MASKAYTGLSKSDSGQKVWPDNLINAYDHLQIDVEDYEAKKVRGQRRSSNSGTSVRAVGSGGSTLNSPLVGNIKKWLMSYSYSVSDTVMLPIPDDILFKDGPKWEGKDIGIIGRLLLKL